MRRVANCYTPFTLLYFLHADVLRACVGSLWCRSRHAHDVVILESVAVDALRRNDVIIDVTESRCARRRHRHARCQSVDDCCRQTSDRQGRSAAGPCTHVNLRHAADSCDCNIPAPRMTTFNPPPPGGGHLPPVNDQSGQQGDFNVYETLINENNRPIKRKCVSKQKHDCTR